MNTVTPPTALAITDLLTAVDVESYDIDVWCVQTARKAHRWASAETIHPVLEDKSVNNPIETITSEINQYRAALDSLLAASEAVDELIPEDYELLEKLLSDATPEEQAMFGYTPTPTEPGLHIQVGRFLGGVAGFVYHRRQKIADVCLEVAAFTALVLVGLAVLTMLAGVEVFQAGQRLAESGKVEEAVEKVTATTAKVKNTATNLGWGGLFVALVSLGWALVVVLLIKEVAMGSLRFVDGLIQQHLMGE